MQEYDPYGAACTQVPAANEKMVAKYAEQLQSLRSLGR